MIKLADEEWRRMLTNTINQQKIRIAEDLRQQEIAAAEKAQQEAGKQVEAGKMQAATEWFIKAQEADRKRISAQDASAVYVNGNAAIKYYEKFIKLTAPGDERIQLAKNAIADLKVAVQAAWNNAAQ